MIEPGVEIRRSADRGLTRTSWLESRHSFSYGSYYDPGHVGFGPLIVDNEDRLAPGAGFGDHHHRDVDILTWVVAGALAHEDGLGHREVIAPGTVQRLTAGTGVTHSEWAAGPHPAHYVQMWVHSDQPGPAPGYARHDVSDALGAGRLVPVASGRAGSAAPITLAVTGAEFAVAQLGAGAGVPLPPAALVHLHVVTGAVQLAGAGALAAGDTARITDGTGRSITAESAAEVLVWRFDATVDR